ncbi:uncharacterized protein [Diadema setosum]|uniref:uncharacterized protein n=1 Tax=Diadema setosum TaxID=31175 RepID=UPI003B3A3149
MAYRKIKRCRKGHSPVLTPESVPRFVIPSRIQSQTGSVSSLLSTGHQCSPLFKTSQGEGNNICAGKHSGSEPLLHRYHCYLDPTEKSPVKCADTHQRDLHNEVWSGGDPGLKLSMTYEHIPILKTPYGFYHLKHRPNSTQTESCLKRVTVPAQTKCGDEQSPVSSGSPEECRWQLARPEHRRLSTRRTHTVESRLSTTISDEASTIGSLSKTTSECLETNDVTLYTLNSNLHEEMKTDKERVISSTAHKLSFTVPNVCTSAPFVTRTTMTPKWSIDFDRYDAINRLQMLCARQLQKRGPRYLGELELTMTYDRQRRKLRVLLVQANGVGLASGTKSKRVNMYFHLCLMPYKRQQQRSSVFRGTYDPMILEEFEFDLSPCDMLSHSLRIQVRRSHGCNPMEKLLPKCFGELWLNLAPLQSASEEVHIREDLRPVKFNKETSTLNVSVCYHSKPRKLCVTVVRAQDVYPTGILNTAPSCRIRVEVTQVRNGSLSTQVKHSVAKHRSSNPVFKEAMTFGINDLNNLRNGMTVVCTLSRRGAAGQSKTVGEVRLGVGSKKPSETQQWRDVIQNPGKCISQWHAL